ncbi:MAG: HlyD family secretion protein [Verrucomicrobia bacterium]|nr:HlyD family secretion protein [Verrucomicrobiota bacterium]
MAKGDQGLTIHRERVWPSPDHALAPLSSEAGTLRHDVGEAQKAEAGAAVGRWKGEILSSPKASPAIAGVEPHDETSRQSGDFSPERSESSRGRDVGGPSLPDAFPKPKAIRKVIGAGVICLGLLTPIGFQLWCESSPSTDQARLERNSYPVSSRIAGPIGKIYVSNGQSVKAGDLLVEIDKRPLEARLAAARAEAAQAQASLQAIAARLAKTQPELEKAVALLRHRERELDPVMLDYEALLGAQQKKGASPARLWRARRAYEAALRLYLEAKAALASAIDRVQADQGLRERTAAKLQEADTTVQDAERQLSCARIYAPVNGRVAFDKSKLMQRLRAGETFLNLIGEPWVVANFKKSELKRLKPGQRVRIRIGPIKERTFQGKVAGALSRGSRATISPMPARRLVAGLLNRLEAAPVKIVFDAEGLRDFEDRLMDLGPVNPVAVAAE